jgi:hypothetical protein
MARVTRKRSGGKDSANPLRWYLLIHQLPPEPLYLRAKIRQRLAKVGAVALKNAVYVLPLEEDCLEDFEWIAEEATSGGGEAYLCEADFRDAKTNAALVERFRRERDADYEVLARSIREWTRKARRRSGANPPEEDLPTRLIRSRRRFDEIARIDFFRARGRAEVERLLGALERSVPSDRTAGRRARSRIAELSNQTWVTRKGIKVDRIASAWLVRRFLDPKVRFRFIDPAREAARPGETTFDMIGGDFTHEADRCTFETICRRAGLKEPGLIPVSEIVHEIDLRDGKFGRPETRGIERLVTGIVNACARDEERLDRGFALFDELYESFRRKKPASKKEVRS